MMTRIDGDFAGGYPGQAIYYDGGMLVNFIEEIPTKVSKEPISILAIPLFIAANLCIDIPMDIIMSPIDLGLWPCGYRKETREGKLLGNLG